MTQARIVSETNVPIVMEPGRVHPLASLPSIALAPGVAARLAWSKGALLEVLEMEAGATCPAQRLNEELITYVREGSATCVVGDQSLRLEQGSLLYLTPGTARSLRAGPKGLGALEVFSPVRVDLLRMAGAGLPETADVSFPDQGVTPSLEPGVVHDLLDLPLTPLTDPDPSLPDQRSAANSRLVWGRNVMLSFIRMEPDSFFPVHSHPEHQIMLLLTGAMEEGVMDTAFSMREERNDVILLPGGMLHSGRMSALGAGALDVFWPVRPDYMARAEKGTA
jgi:gluconolactonase